MATTDIVIPATEAERHVWIGNVGEVLAGSADARIVDAAGNERDVAFINLAADGVVSFRAANQTDGTVEMPYLVKGGWHAQRACKFYYDKTTASTNILVKGVYPYNGK